MSEKTDSRFWATVGKIGALVGLLLGLFALYRQIWPNEAQLTATCSQADIQLPPIASPKPPALPEERRQKLLDRIQEALREDRLPPEAARQVASIIVSDVEGEMRIAWDAPPVPRLFLTCQVRNSGGKQAKGVALSLPVPILQAQVKGSNLSLPSGADTVDLGDLHPDAQTILQVWSTTGYLREADVRLAYTDGRGKVDFPTMAYGWTAWFVRNGAALAFGALGGLISLLVAALLESTKKTTPSPGSGPAAAQQPGTSGSNHVEQ